MAEVVRLRSVPSPSAQSRPPSGEGFTLACALPRSFIARGVCSVGYGAFATLGAVFMAAASVMSMLAGRACSAAIWCEARR